MDKVFIEGLEIEALIGIYDWERRIRQPLVFDLEMAFDNRRPAATDAIADTLDYKAVSKRLMAYVSESSFGLVETLAERCAALILDEFDVAHLRLKLSTPGAVRGARAVGVIIERSREARTVERAQPAANEAVGVAAEDVAPPHLAVAGTDEVASAAPQAVATPPAANEAMPAAAGATAPLVAPRIDAPATTEVTPSAAAPDAVVAPVLRAPVERRQAPVSRADAMIAAISGSARGTPPAPDKPRPAVRVPAYLSLGSNIAPEQNLRAAVAALRARFGDVQLSPVYRTRAVGFDGPDFLNAIALVHSDLNPFALHKWLHRLEEAQGRDRRDAAYSNRPLDIDIIYFGDLVLDGPGDFQLPRAELNHAFVLKPLADLAPDFVDPIRHATLAQLWKIHPDFARPPQQVALVL